MTTHNEQPTQPQPRNPATVDDAPAWSFTAAMVAALFPLTPSGDDAVCDIVQPRAGASTVAQPWGTPDDAAALADAVAAFNPDDDGPVFAGADIVAADDATVRVVRFR